MMDLTQFLILFAIGFFIGLTSRLFYAKMSGQLQAKKPEPVSPKVRYISPKSDSDEESKQKAA